MESNSNTFEEAEPEEMRGRVIDLCDWLRSHSIYNENQVLKRRVAQLENELVIKTRRLEDMTLDWKRMRKRIKADETSDIICDFIAEFYHRELLEYLKKRGAPVRTWSDVSAALSNEFKRNETTTRDLCCECARLTPEEWESLYDLKRSRNLRVHPRRNADIVRRILRGMQDGVLKTALQKMFSVLTLTH